MRISSINTIGTVINHHFVGKLLSLDSNLGVQTPDEYLNAFFTPDEYLNAFFVLEDVHSQKMYPHSVKPSCNIRQRWEKHPTCAKGGENIHRMEEARDTYEQR